MEIQDIEGIGEVYAEKLGIFGITTVDDLLAMGGTPKAARKSPPPPG